MTQDQVAALLATQTGTKRIVQYTTQDGVFSGRTSDGFLFDAYYGGDIEVLARSLVTLGIAVETPEVQSPEGDGAADLPDASTIKKMRDDELDELKLRIDPETDIDEWRKLKVAEKRKALIEVV